MAPRFLPLVLAWAVTANLHLKILTSIILLNISDQLIGTLSVSLRQHFSTLSAFLLNRHESVNEFRHSGDISSKQLANLALLPFYAM